jgi:hypothetical protein
MRTIPAMARRAQLLGILASSVLLAVVVAEAFTGGYSTPLTGLLDGGWGRTITLDLYIGLLLVAAWIAHRERDWSRRAAWIAAIVMFGNIATGIYLWRVARSSSHADEFLNGPSTT